MGSWVGTGENGVDPLIVPISEVTPRPPAEQFQFQSQQQVQQEVIGVPTVGRLPTPVHCGRGGSVLGWGRSSGQTPLSDLCRPLSQHQLQETWRQSPQSLGLWVRASLTAGETEARPPKLG